MTAKKIKIIFATASVSGGGAERQLINIINSLSLEKYEIILVNTGFEKVPAQLKCGVVYYCCNKVNAIKAFPDLYRITNQVKPNYLFTTSSNIGYMLSILKIIFRSKPKVIVRVSVPPSEHPNVSFKGKCLEKISKYCYTHVDTFIAQTEFMKQDLLPVYKIKPDKIKVIQNIIDIEYLEKEGCYLKPIEYSEANFNIIASGALYSIKGFDLLIEAFAKICQKHQNVQLYILGEERYEIGYKQTLLDLIQKLNLIDKVFLLGHKSNPYPYYKYADLFVLSSRKEGFPNVVLESLYFKTPVVATNCVDFSNTFQNGVGGYVVNKGSSDELYKGISKAIETLSKPCEHQIVNYNYENLFI